MFVTRREFVRASSMLAAAFGLQTLSADEVLAAEEDGGIVWLQCQGCTGCSMSLLNTLTVATSENWLRQSPGLSFHPTLLAAAGPNAIAAATAAASHDGFVLVVEGAIPTSHAGKHCYLWPGTTAFDGVRELAKRARSVIAVGTCAAYGGIAASVPPRRTNPTGAKGVSAAVREKRVINIPGCPPHPDWIVGTIAKVLSGTPPVIDILGRPHALFSNTIHSQCFYESGLAAKYCLEERGCKGSRTFANCPAIMWNPLKAGEKGVNWCVGARCPCLGCTQPDFPDGMLPFHAEVDD